MRWRLLIATLALGGNLLMGQEKPAEAKRENFEAAIIPVKTLSGDSFRRLAVLLGVFNVSYKWDDQLRTIVVYAPKEVVAQMRRVVAELDRPGSEAAIGRNIEMTLAFLRCSVKPPAESVTLPADLEAVARQLRAVTQYKDIRLWDVVPLHVQEGKQTNQTTRLPRVPTDDAGATSTVELLIRPESVSRREDGRYVRLDRVIAIFHLRHPTSPLVTVNIDTAGDFKEGQKSVLGKVSGHDDGSAIFVVISLKVLD